MFQDVLAFVPQFAVWGIGFGNHEMVYPMFSHLNTWRNAQYENEYLQLVEEMGFVGLTLGVAFLGTIMWNRRLWCAGGGRGFLMPPSGWPMGWWPLRWGASPILASVWRRYRA